MSGYDAIQKTSGSIVMDLGTDFKNTLAPVVTAGMLISAQEMNNTEGNQLLRGNTQTKLDGPIVPEQAGATFFSDVDSKAKTSLT